MAAETCGLGNKNSFWFLSSYLRIDNFLIPSEIIKCRLIFSHCWTQWIQSSLRSSILNEKESAKVNSRRLVWVTWSICCPWFKARLSSASLIPHTKHILWISLYHRWCQLRFSFLPIFGSLLPFPLKTLFLSQIFLSVFPREAESFFVKAG